MHVKSKIWIYQENHRRTASGLLALAEAGGRDAVRGLQALESTVGHDQVKVSFFRGFETMTQPNILEIQASFFFTNFIFPILEKPGLGWMEWDKGLGRTLMESKNVTLRLITKKVAALRLERLLRFHLVHPEMTDEHLHPSRSVFQVAVYVGFQEFHSHL